MYQFEIGLINYIKELHKEREAKAAKKAEDTQNQLGESFMRNGQETKTQANHKRGADNR